MDTDRKEEIWKIVNGFITAILVFVLIYFMIKSSNKESDLINRGKLTNGILNKAIRDKKGTGVDVEYVFEIGGKQYSGMAALPNIDPSKGYLLEGKSFPVIYEKSDPKNSSMLVTKYEFQFYRVSFPDSLNWVMKYIW